jgi:hypothetical protein
VQFSALVVKGKCPLTGNRGGSGTTASPDRGSQRFQEFQRFESICGWGSTRKAGVYLLSGFRLLALVANANSSRRRIASEREGLSFCRLAQLSIADRSGGGSRTVRTGSLPVAGRPGFFGVTFSIDGPAMFW